MGLMSMLGGGKGGGGWKNGGGGGQRSNGCQERPEKRLWIGNLPTFTDGDSRIAAEKELKVLLQAGGDCKYTSIQRKGTGVATFPSAEDVKAAIGALAGTEFQGQVLEFDT